MVDKNDDAFTNAMHQVIHDIIYKPFPMPREKCPECGEMLWMKTPDMKKWRIFLLYCEKCDYEREERTPDDAIQKIIDSDHREREIFGKQSLTRVR